jgi:hypothetical protein
MAEKVVTQKTLHLPVGDVHVVAAELYRLPEGDFVVMQLPPSGDDYHPVVSAKIVTAEQSNAYLTERGDGGQELRCHVRILETSAGLD